MTDMQIPVRLGRETGLNVGVNALFQILIYKIMYILDCEINIVSNSTKYSSNQDYSFPLSYQDGELLWTGTQQELLELAVALHKNGIIMYGNRKARFIEIVRALSSTFHITINDVYVKKTRMLDRSTAVTPFLDKLKKAYEQVVERHLR